MHQDMSVAYRETLSFVDQHGYYNFPHIKQHALKHLAYPTLYVSTSGIKTKLDQFRTALPNVTPHYAVKANPSPAIVKLLADNQCRFEIASQNELMMLVSLGVSPKNVLYSNPIKPKSHLEYAVEKGIDWYVADNIQAIEQIVSTNRNAQIYLRIYTENTGSAWPLSTKFGAAETDIVSIVKYCSDNNVALGGVTFHVGSQCYNPDNWVIGINAANNVFDIMVEYGLKPKLLNLGGGFPVVMTNPVPSMKTIGRLITKTIAESAHPYVNIVAEPGRFLVADTSVLASNVVMTTKRGNQKWMYLDTGVFHGLAEANCGIDYSIRVFSRDGKEKTNDQKATWTVAGPTCDSVDVVGDMPLPSTIDPGDILFFLNGGAYTTAYASSFNGFPAPNVILI
jgi:ornithine decarboxylase